MNIETLLAEITAIRTLDICPLIPPRTIQALQGLHMSDILGYDDDDGVDEAGPNDIDMSRMATKVKTMTTIP